MGADASFASPSGRMRVIQPSVSASSLPVSNDPRSTLQNLKGEPDPKPIENISLQVNPGRLASRHLFDWFGKTLMTNFLSAPNTQ